MAKTKTLKEREFSFDAMSSQRLRRGVSASKHDPRSTLRNRNLVIAALTQALMEGDAQAFKEIFAAHLAVMQKEAFYVDAGISRRTLYRMLAPNGNPTLENSARVVKAIAKPAA